MKGIQLAGRVAVVTGGARGIGRATAEALRDQGARVAIGDIDEVELKETARELGVFGGRLDVTDPCSVTEFLTEVEDELGPVDVWINNAGIMPVGSVLEHDDALLRRTVEINLLGVLHGARAAARAMVGRGQGRIVNVASVSGRLPAPGTALYSATKFAVVGFGEAMDAELAPAGVRVSTIFPSFTSTALIDGIPPGRMMTPVPPERIGRAIVRVLRRGRRHVVVPAKLAAGTALWMLFPRPVAAFWRRVLRLNTTFLHPDERRAAYHERITTDTAR
jgi:NAD(P)-dependent dehydrogenase (short-subunit alcohol dehydrogenase family)